jgi:hypothetical protein
MDPDLFYFYRVTDISYHYIYIYDLRNKLFFVYHIMFCVSHVLCITLCFVYHIMLCVSHYALCVTLCFVCHIMLCVSH